MVEERARFAGTRGFALFIICLVLLALSAARAAAGQQAAEVKPRISDKPSPGSPFACTSSGSPAFLGDFAAWRITMILVSGADADMGTSFACRGDLCVGSLYIEDRRAVSRKLWGTAERRVDLCGIPRLRSEASRIRPLKGCRQLQERHSGGSIEYMDY
jgi:hypothetical protein